MTGFPKQVRDIIACRSQGVCERCGVAPALQVHHRRPRGIGGSKRADTNQPSNGLHLCPPCHCAVESDRELSMAHGWLIRQGMTPADIPVMRRGVWVRLDDDGNIETRGDWSGLDQS